MTSPGRDRSWPGAYLGAHSRLDGARLTRQSVTKSLPARPRPDSAGRFDGGFDSGESPRRECGQLGMRPAQRAPAAASASGYATLRGFAALYLRRAQPLWGVRLRCAFGGREVRGLTVVCLLLGPRA